MSRERPFTIRRARLGELPRLPAIESAAGRRFEGIVALAEVPEDPTPLAELRDAAANGWLWVAVVAGAQIAGFAYGFVLDGAFHLEEIDVLPEWGERGIGTALVRTMVGVAAAAGLPAVTLTTFRDVPWNAPFYAKLGFHELDAAAWTPRLAEVVRDEARRGLAPHLRLVMRLDLTPPPPSSRAGRTRRPRRSSAAGPGGGSRRGRR